ncbi:MAG: DNA/RNA nuclease SfsA [Rhodospirillales bacterium]
MDFTKPLLRGKLVSRYKRFFADVELADGGGLVTAHCANSGSMKSVNEPGADVWITQDDNPKRKLKYTWEMIRIGGAMVGVNTSRPNHIVEEAIRADAAPGLSGYETLRREVKYGKNSRIDILLEDPAKGLCYVEVKNVTMRRDLSPGAPAEFPDSVTTRGAKHLEELSDMVKAGHRAVMVYFIQRDDADAMTAAEDLDPGYAEGLRRALKAGVEAVALGCALSETGITVDRVCEVIRP